MWHEQKKEQAGVNRDYLSNDITVVEMLCYGCEVSEAKLDWGFKKTITSQKFQHCFEQLRTILDRCIAANRTHFQGKYLLRGL